jgi:hypothetical protein
MVRTAVGDEEECIVPHNQTRGPPHEGSVRLEHNGAPSAGAGVAEIVSKDGAHPPAPPDQAPDCVTP